MTLFRMRTLLAALGLLAVFALVASEADARAGRSGSLGSRGTRTFTPPPATQTAPTQPRSMERTATQPGQPGVAARPNAAPTTGAAARPGLFNRPGLLGGLAAGFLGAGLLGMLFGHGLFSNLAGFASILGLLAQIGLVVAIGWFGWRWWQRRSQPQPAFAGIPPGSDVERPQPARMVGPSQGSGSFLNPQPAAPSAPSDDIGLKAEDYDAFERLLGEIQSSYSAEDTNALRARTTPEMMEYLSEELEQNTKRGVVAALSGVKLLQGDLSEAWREGDEDYATVAMRYQIVDQLVDRRTRQVVEGEREPIEVTELWTFVRPRGQNWMLSGIQQVDEAE